MDCHDDFEPTAALMARRVGEFSTALAERKEAFARLRSEPVPKADPAILGAALEELRNQHDELLATEEELRTQLEDVTSLTVRAAAERERYRQLFDGAPQAYIVTDRAGVIRDVNQAAYRLLAPEGRALVGRPLAVLTEATDTRALRQAINEACLRGVARTSVRLRRKSGAAVTVNMSCTLVESDERQFWTVTEVAESERPHMGRAELERRLRDSDDLLVRERSIRVRLERTDRAKDRFIAMLSHDLRGPIHAVLGWTELLRRETFGKDARDRALVTIERNARAQLALVEELLDISRLTADKMPLEVTPLDLGVIARRVVEGLVPKAATHEIELTCACEAVTVFADRRRLEQVMHNLLANALKFTPAKGAIHARVFRDGEHALLEVKDSGRGIESASQETIFDSYTQTSDEDNRRGGLGLGLFIVRQLVELQGGTVEVQSAGVGSGSTFTVSFPAREPAEITEISVVDLPDAGIELEGIHVLVVDDEPDSRELIGQILIERGATVSLASTAEMALRMFISDRPSVVLSDLGLPDADGYELLRRFRRLDTSTPAVALSGYAFRTDVQRAISNGFAAHLPKPVEPDRLVETLMRVVTESRERDSRVAEAGKH